MIAKRISQITPSVTLEITAKAKELKKQGVDVVNFASGEPDFGTPDFINEAAIKAIREGFTKYTPATGTPQLKEAVCEKLKKENGLDYAPDQIVVSCGAKHSLYNLFQTICQEGDEILLPSPYWLSYPEMIKLAGAKPVVVKTDMQNFTLELGALKKAITKKTKALILNSPSNPTGAVYSVELLKKISELSLEKKLLIVSDEIYEHLIYDGQKHVSIASLGKDIYDLVFVVNGVSKSHAMTGWRIGYMAGRRDVIKGVSSLQSHSTSNPSSISQAAALAALKEGSACIRVMAAEFEKRRNAMIEELKKIKALKAIKPGGAFYCFVDISRTGMKSVDFTKKMLTQIHVAAIPGKPFGEDDYVRLSFAVNIPEIKKGIQRIKDWLS
ncbi:MAG: pyridoxal phosphate-dependent aminotransferase [Candidatus Omnitrophica bacterium]|nr:pyridoxal phosphate-dependent aminotransferase [Candidatus Omnitrophota bacterium]